jgi:hypothetical protein
MSTREKEYLVAMGLVCYSTLMRRCKVKNPTFYTVPVDQLLGGPWWW